MQQRTHKRGFIGVIVLVIVALIVLGYFNINIRQVLASSGVQENLNYAWGLVVTEFRTLINQGTALLTQYKK